MKSCDLKVQGDADVTLKVKFLTLSNTLGFRFRLPKQLKLNKSWYLLI